MSLRAKIQEYSMSSAVASTQRSATGFLIMAAGALALLAAPMAARAGDQSAMAKTGCRHQAIANGRHIQPRQSDFVPGKCLPDASVGLITGDGVPVTRWAAGERPPIDADEAFIMDVIKRNAQRP
jgi:hypothetical protein